MASQGLPSQLTFTFVEKPGAAGPHAGDLPAALQTGTQRDLTLEQAARTWLDELGFHEGAIQLRVLWNSRLRSTAGYAHWPQWRVKLNPRLMEFEGQVERTLKHEVAHLIAYARANRRRIEAHGPEWRKACADLGIPDESARHTLPLPRSRQQHKHHYVCPGCGHIIGRVRPFARATACLACCRNHNGGHYDPRFKLKKTDAPPPTGANLSA